MKVPIVKSFVTRHRIWPLGFVFFCIASAGLVAFDVPPAAAQDAASKSAAGAQQAAPESKNTEPDAKSKWTQLSGKWEPCEFGGDGPIEITDKVIEVGYGDPLTGVRWKGSFPKDNYEVEIEARRTDGFDFFCALTFPVAETHCTLVLGGWGGGVTGLSNIDGYDASDNETTQFRAYDDDKWFRVRVRVDTKHITCWIDDKEIIQQEREGHEFGIRFEMDPCVPLGVAAYQCDAEYRNLRWRPLNQSSSTSDGAPIK